MSTQLHDVEVSRADRAQARSHAQHAVLAWQDEVIAALGSLTSTLLGEQGPDQVALFDAVIHEDEGNEYSEELVSATVVCANTQICLSRTSGPAWAWAEAVAIWDDLRQVLSGQYQTPMPGGLLVDLDTRVVFVWEPYYCPEEGNDPDRALELARAGGADDDPFDALLEDMDNAGEALVARYNKIMDTYDLTPPALPSHEPGQCWVDDEGDDVDD